MHFCNRSTRRRFCPTVRTTHGSGPFDSASPAQTGIFDREVKQLERRIVGGEAAARFDNLAQRTVQRLDRVGGVNHLADAGGKREERDDVLQAAPRLHEYTQWAVHQWIDCSLAPMSDTPCALAASATISPHRSPLTKEIGAISDIRAQTRERVRQYSGAGKALESVPRRGI
jgi:hypothetical protein